MDYCSYGLLFITVARTIVCEQYDECHQTTSECSVTCGIGTRRHNQICCAVSDCRTWSTHTTTCTRPTCIPIIDGQWGTWERWTGCSVTCGQGTKQRTRRCDNPAPRNGGANCVGSSIGTASCFVQPVHGGWGKWGRYSACSKSCGSGTRSRGRSCNNPIPSTCGNPCTGSSSDSDDCNTHCCPVNGGWSSWGSWSSCSVTCGYGERLRERICNKPVPRCGGAFCGDKSWSTQQCFIQPVHGGWGQWGEISPCSEKCGGGEHTRTRRCNSPTPTKCGNQCFGASAYTTQCNTHECSLDGFWNEWGQWSDCLVTCGDGLRLRHRNCTEPKHGGIDCVGNSSDAIQCNIKQVDGGWNEWGEYSPCTVTCGVGFQTRNRSCTSPVPDYCGETCFGDEKEIIQCNNTDCKRKQYEEAYATTQIPKGVGVNTNDSATTIQTNKGGFDIYIYLIIGTVCGVAVIIAVILIAVFSVRYRRNKRQTEEETSKSEKATYETPEFQAAVPREENAYACLDNDGNGNGVSNSYECDD